MADKNMPVPATKRITAILIVIFLLSAGMLITIPTASAYKEVAGPDYIADTPWRVVQGTAYFPLLVEIKDGENTRIYQIIVLDANDPTNPSKRYTDTPNHLIGPTEHIWYKIYNDGTSDMNFGNYNTDANGNLQIRVTFRTGNFGTGPPYTHTVEVARLTQSLPSSADFTDWHRTNLHTHAQYSEDSWEFGPVLDTSGDSTYSAAADYQDVKFIAINEHAYDVSSSDWTDLVTSVTNANQAGYTSKLIKGLEVSAYNGEDTQDSDLTDAGHLLTIDAGYIDNGQGEAKAQRPTNNEDWVLTQVQTESNNNVAYIAHPFDEYVGDMYNGWEWSFDPNVMGTNRWNTISTWFGNSDPSDDKVLRGLEIWNYAVSDTANANARTKWLDLLDDSKVAFGLGTTDSHKMGNGDPNQNQIYNNPGHFGAVTTSVYSTIPNPTNIVTGLREGRTIVSDGPLVKFEVSNGVTSPAMIGDRIRGCEFTLDIDYATSNDFGSFNKITIYLNPIDNDPLTTEWVHEITSGIGGNSGSVQVNLNGVFDPAHDFSGSIGDFYIRLEGDTGGNSHKVYTNPIWLDKCEKKDWTEETPDYIVNKYNDYTDTVSAGDPDRVVMVINDYWKIYYSVSADHGFVINHAFYDSDGTGNNADWERVIYKTFTPWIYADQGGGTNEKVLLKNTFVASIYVENTYPLIANPLDFIRITVEYDLTVLGKTVDFDSIYFFNINGEFLIDQYLTGQALTANWDIPVVIDIDIGSSFVDDEFYQAFPGTAETNEGSAIVTGQGDAGTFKESSIGNKRADIYVTLNPPNPPTNPEMYWLLNCHSSFTPHPDYYNDGESLNGVDIDYWYLGKFVNKNNGDNSLKIGLINY